MPAVQSCEPRPTRLTPLFWGRRLAASGLHPSGPAEPHAHPPRVHRSDRLAADARRSGRFPGRSWRRMPTSGSSTRLLASPRYGERWARHWMDVAHFAETHGNDQDRPRPNAWPYRDYLIRSFNDDKPYAQFVEEQVAGDVLFPDDPQATVATRLSRGRPVGRKLADVHSSTTRSTRRSPSYLDRDDMVTTACRRSSAPRSIAPAATITSSIRFRRPIITPCRPCSPASIGPIGRIDPDPAVALGRRELAEQQHATIRTRDEPALLAERRRCSRSRRRWKSNSARAAQRWTVARRRWQCQLPAARRATPQPDGSVLFGGTRPDKDTYTLDARDATCTASRPIRLEVLTDRACRSRGPGRQDNGNLHLSEFKAARSRTADGGDADAGAPSSVGLRRFRSDGWTVADGDRRQARRPPGASIPRSASSHTARLRIGTAGVAGGNRRLDGRARATARRRHLIGRPRISLTTAANPAGSRPFPSPAAGDRGDACRPSSRTHASSKPSWPRTCSVGSSTASWPRCRRRSWSTRRPANFKAGRQLQAGRQAAAGPCAAARRHQSAARRSRARRARLRDRHRSAISRSPNPTDEGSRRAALASWLADPQNVLTWRSIVNRVWHYHFGRGIVDTPNDLGRMGGSPVASRIARLAGRRVSRQRRLAQAAASADRHQRRLSAVVANRCRACRASTATTGCCGG